MDVVLPTRSGLKFEPDAFPGPLTTNKFCWIETPPQTAFENNPEENVVRKKYLKPRKTLSFLSELGKSG
jgi:hypothetical protein